MRNPKKNLRKESWERTSGITKWEKLGQVGVRGRSGTRRRGSSDLSGTSGTRRRGSSDLRGTSGTRTRGLSRVPGLPIRDCARGCNNCVHTRAQMSAIDVTEKTFLLVLELGTFGS